MYIRFGYYLKIVTTGTKLVFVTTVDNNRLDDPPERTASFPLFQIIWLARAQLKLKIGHLFDDR